MAPTREVTIRRWIRGDIMSLGYGTLLTPVGPPQGVGVETDGPPGRSSRLPAADAE